MPLDARSVRALKDAAIAGLTPAFARSETYTAQQWVQRCVDDLAQLWKVGDCWAVTEVSESKSGRILQVIGVAGDYTPDLQHEIELWARGVGVKTIFITGRKGWARRMKDYELVTVTMKKDI